MNKLLLDNGIWPITYAKSAASGPPVFEFMRKHPDTQLTGFQAQFDQEFVEEMGQADSRPGKDDFLQLDIVRAEHHATEAGGCGHQ